MNILKKILPPIIFFILFIAAVALHAFFPIPKTFSYPYNFLGLIFIILGTLINFWADSMFKEKGTTVKPFEKPSSLIIEGPFRLTRHPMYLGFVLILFGTAIMLGTLVAFAFPFLMFFIVERFFVPAEEEDLEDIFKDQYSVYKKRVDKWL